MPRTFADFFRFLFRARSRTLARPCTRTYRDAQYAYQRLPSVRAMGGAARAVASFYEKKLRVRGEA